MYLTYKDITFVNENALLLDIFFYALFAFVAIGMMFPASKGTSVTTLDYIIILIILVLANLPPDYFVGQSQYAAAIPKLFILFYACEFVLLNLTRYAHILKLVIMSVLALIALKALFLV